MFYVLFTGTTPADKSALGEQYYSTFQPILSKIDGFIDETPFEEPGRPEVSCLLARFADEASLSRWRNQPTHLRIMHHARHNIFEQYRITVGAATPDSFATQKGKQRVVVAYQRQATEDLHQEHMQLLHVANAKAIEMAADFNFYRGEDIFMWVSRLDPGSDVDEFEASLQRVPNDAVHRMYVLRDYSKDDRREAPIGIDDAEEQAGLLRKTREEEGQS